VVLCLAAMMAVAAFATQTQETAKNNPVIDMLDVDENEISPTAAAVLSTTNDALSPADQDTLADMLKESESIELVNADGESIDADLEAEEQQLEQAELDAEAQADEESAMEKNGAELESEESAEEDSAAFIQIDDEDESVSDSD